MTFFEHDENSNQSRTFPGRRLILAIIIVLVASIAFGFWFFFISSPDNAIGNSDKYLPPNCYSINGKQICPPKS
jgi:hypothetical protein